MTFSIEIKSDKFDNEYYAANILELFLQKLLLENGCIAEVSLKSNEE